MAALGAEMLKPRIAGAESAEAKSLDQVAQNSTVGNVAVSVSEAYTKALKFCARWLGANEDEVIYKLNTDYNPKGMDANAINSLWATTLGGGMSYKTFYENLQKGEVANPSRTEEQERALIALDQSGMSDVTE